MRTEANHLKPHLNVSVGDMIKRDLDYLGWTQEDLSQITDLSRKTLSSIFNNKQRLSLETATKLSHALKGSPEYWMNLDTSYWINESDNHEKLSPTERKALVRKYVPVLELQKKGWFEDGKSAENYEKIYDRIWDSDDSVRDFNVYEEEAKYCARRSKNDEDFTRNYSITWYQIAKNRASSISANRYSREKLKDISDSLASYTIAPDGIHRIIRNLKEAGVKFFVQSHLSKTFLDGASFFDGDSPVIVYTARYDRIDNFWFTLAHEMAHLLLHFDKNKDSFFLDNNLEKAGDSDIEKEADEKAAGMLKIREILKMAEPNRSYVTETNLSNISNSLGVEKSLVVGILQHNGYVDYRKLNKHKKPVKALFPEELVLG